MPANRSCRYAYCPNRESRSLSVRAARNSPAKDSAFSSPSDWFRRYANLLLNSQGAVRTMYSPPSPSALVEAFPLVPTKDSSAVPSCGGGGGGGAEGGEGDCAERVEF